MYSGSNPREYPHFIGRGAAYSPLYVIVFVFLNDVVRAPCFYQIGGIGKVTENILKEVFGITTCEEMLQKSGSLCALFSRSSAGAFVSQCLILTVAEGKVCKIHQNFQFDKEKTKTTKCLLKCRSEFFFENLLFLPEISACFNISTMKRPSTRDISTFFTKKPTTENVSQAQANEPEINIPRSPATQPSQQAGGDAFVGEGFKCWNRLGTIRDHVGKHMSSHNNAVVAMELFKKQKGSIASALSKQTKEVVSAYQVSDTIDSNKAQSITHLLMSFDFVFVAHLMVAIFGITNELNVALQKHDQDIVNAMAMVDITKTSLQKLRDEGWNFHMDKVTSFLVKYGVEVPNMEANYIIPGRRMYRDRYQNMKTHREQL
ncbi:hypothetical protein POM88_018760 [Heracleum sosnowskyi]|uniref:DUF4371 domain-containing protein n=1 Tax=Heracleum sosnowskyi TaxID=360622 RepID=A0AAD8IUG1_9APIA|nr:hypothetical protein POM88_018760 [Heracleum sosnowskyi]